MIRDLLQAYARDVRAARRANPGIGGDGTALELLLAPRFQALLDAMLAGRPGAPRVLPEYRIGGIGRPDIAFAQPNSAGRSFIELKEPGKSIEPSQLRGAHDKSQFARFSELPLWAMCNFHTVHLYRRGERLDQAQFIAAAALDPATSDAAADRLIDRADTAGFARIVEQLILAPLPPMRTARDFAVALAHAARLVRDIVQAQCSVIPRSPALQAVRQVFNEQLFARPEAGGYDAADGDADFAMTYAQTLAFGLLLARETTGYTQMADRNAYQLMPAERYGLLRGTLRAITQDEMLPLLGVALDVVLDTVNAATPDLLARRPDQADPILYFYEEFLEVFDPRARMRHGVFFTPVPVVNYIVHETDRVLRAELGTEGFLDPTVHTLDPASGTGTFLMSAIAHVAARAGAEHGEGSVPADLADFAQRLHAFELLLGAYTVAQFRLLRELADRHVARGIAPQVRLADTLAPAGDQINAQTPIDFLNQPIVTERQAADALKTRQRIIAIFGNPPYRRLKSGETTRLIGQWMNALWDDLKQPVRNAGWGRSLNAFPDLYIAFWRWAIWRLFEAPGAEGRGVVAFITNRGFLAGRGFGGLRRMLRDRFDTLLILDLRGDNRGALPVGAEADDNVFNIETGVCITIGIARGGERAAGQQAEVRYSDIWRAGAYRRAEKLARLDAARGGQPLPWVTLPGRGMDQLKPIGFAAHAWLGLDQAFRFRSNGIVTYRDHFAWATNRDVLAERIKDFVGSPADEAAKKFKETRDRKAGPALAVPFSELAIEQLVYRPLDQRFLYNRREYIDFSKPAMQAAWGSANVALMALEDGTGRGPAVWCHGAKPDQHAFSGRGGWVFLLHDHGGTEGHYLHPGLLDGLEGAYGRRPTPIEVLDATLCLLSARSYTTRFAADLEDSFPHIPFPTDLAVFEEAVRIGAEIRALETFARPPATAFRRARILGQGTGVTLEPPPPSGFVGAGGVGAVPLLADGSLRLGNLSEDVWRFEVSGYPLLHRWLKGRAGDALDAPLQAAMRDVADRIAELLHWFESADAVLDRALAATLGRNDLGAAETGDGAAGALGTEDDEPADSPV